jgi:peptide/nickel transport system substrate-binding protein
MRRIRWQLLIAFGGLILLFGYLLVQSPVEEQPSAPEPVAGGIYREALIGTVSRLNPLLDFNNQVDRDINRLLYRGLIQFDSRGIPQPDLAVSWAVSADATLYTFTLQSDAFWHDGEPVRSDDVIYTYSKFQEDEYPGPADLQSIWKEINFVRLDDRTVQFQLPEPFAPFLDLVSFGLLPDHLLRGVSAEELIDHPFNIAPVGTGPFKFDRFLQESGEISGIHLIAFDEFFGGRAFLDEIELLFFPDEGRALEAYLSEQVMGIGHVGRDVLDRVLASSNLNLHTSSLPLMNMVFLNHDHPEKSFLGVKEFRQALHKAINRQWIINHVLEGQAIIARGPILASSWAFLESLPIDTYDTAAAEEILDGLGWDLPSGANRGTSEYVRSKDEVILSLELVHDTDPVQVAVAEAIQNSWEQLGIEVELVPSDGPTIMEQYLEPRSFEAVLININLGRYADPDPYPFWHDSQVEGGQNYGGFADRNIGIWLEKARTTPDLILRTDLYKNFQFRFQDQSPALLLYSPVYSYAIDSQVQGVRIGTILDPSDRFNNIAEWHIRFRRPSVNSSNDSTS